MDANRIEQICYELSEALTKYEIAYGEIIEQAGKRGVLYNAQAKVVKLDGLREAHECTTKVIQLIAKA